MPRFSDTPVIETVLVDRKDLPSAGAGETPIVGIAPAIGNAIFDAAGVRIRALPMVPNGLPSGRDRRRSGRRTAGSTLQAAGLTELKLGPTYKPGARGPGPEPGARSPEPGARSPEPGARSPAELKPAV